MQLSYLQLKNCYHFNHLKIDFQITAHPVTLILGEQASGKTAIIKNIYQGLSWFPSRFKDIRSAGVVMLDQDIQYQQHQSKIDIGIQIPTEIGCLPESSDPHPQNLNCCHWQLYKTLLPNGVGHSKVETRQLDQCVELYYKAIQHDPLQGLPMIAYYPSERFSNEINLLSKNNPSLFQSHAAYEFAAIPFTTFARFFEWLREVSDIENAQTAQRFQQFIAAQPNPQTATAEQKQDYLNQTLQKIHSQPIAPNLLALKRSLNIVIPEISDIYLDYQPKMQLMVCYQNQICLYQQLSSSLKNWVALIGDIVRRLCILNPMSLYPCEEGEGVLLIDQIDAGLDQEMSAVILDRLHQAFPQLQIIATGQCPDLLDNSLDYQYLRLQQQRLYSIQPKKSWHDYENQYQHMLAPLLVAHPAHETTTAPSKAEEIFAQIQQLTELEQSELNRLLQADDDTKTHILPCSPEI